MKRKVRVSPDLSFSLPLRVFSYTGQLNTFFTPKRKERNESSQVRIKSLDNLYLQVDVIFPAEISPSVCRKNLRTFLFTCDKGLVYPIMRAGTATNRKFRRKEPRTTKKAHTNGDSGSLRQYYRWTFQLEASVPGTRPLLEAHTTYYYDILNRKECPK